MTATRSERPAIALLQAQSLPDAEGGAVPDWIHLLPAGTQVMTADNRGPYRLEDPAALVASAQGARLPIDENHAIDLAAPRGEASPARGYIVELQARETGIWGRVDWTQAGRALLADRAYLGISPVILHDKDRRIVGILRASLTNRPNLRGLTALHTEQPTEDGMSLTAIARALDPAEDPTEAQVLEAIARLRPAAERTVALQAQVGEIGAALGLTAGAAPEAIVTAARARGSARSQVEIALQAEHRKAARLLGLDLKTYTAALKAERQTEESL